MTMEVSFPGLGLQLHINRVAFSLFGLDIYWYGICIGVGLALALLMAFKLAPGFGVDTDRMIDVIIVGLICAIVGGRLYYVLFSANRAYYFSSLYNLIDLRSGGIGIYGAIIGAFLGGGITCRLRKVPLLPLFDLGGMGFLIGQACGRWGNFFNQEAFGTNTTLPWGMISPATISYLTNQQQSLAAQGVAVNPALPVHPTFLYESLWCALGFLVLFLYRKRRRFHGELILMYAIWYGLGRFFIEGLRTDSLMTLGGGLRVSQVIAALSVLAGVCAWIVLRVKTAGKPLLIPALPPRTARVKVRQGNAEQTVEISWPAGEPAPGRERQQELARAKLREEEELAAGAKAPADTDGGAAGGEEGLRTAPARPKEHRAEGKEADGGKAD